MESVLTALAASASSAKVLGADTLAFSSSDGR